MEKNAIIDGATSFIGISLIKELNNYGYNILAVVRPFSQRKRILESFENEHIGIIECDQSNIFDLPRLLSRRVIGFNRYSCIDEYYHIAWSGDFDNPRYNIEGQKKNVEYTINAMKVANILECKKFVAIGSQAECGFVTTPIRSDTKDNPMTAYGEAKCETFDRCCKLSKELGIDFFWPRLLSVYGRYDRPNTLVSLCIDACIKQKTFSITAAEQIWDYVHVDDVAKSLRLVANKGVPLKKYTIASGIGRSLGEYIKVIAEEYNYPQLLNGIGERQYSSDEVMYLVGDVSEIAKDTGMKFEISFEKGITYAK